MKTGLVFEIIDNKAIVMLTGGSLVSLPAKAGWRKGDVVTVRKSSVSARPLWTAAACFLFVILLSAGGQRLYFTERSLISLDINPSMEMGLNRFDRVIRVSAYNDDSRYIVDTVGALHKTYESALEDLLVSEPLSAYLTEDENWIKVAVHSEISDKETMLSETITGGVASLPIAGGNVQVDCEIVSGELVREAHEQGLTPGKYTEILKLVELAPETDIEEYRDKGITEIRNEIEGIIREAAEAEAAAVEAAAAEEVPPPIEEPPVPEEPPVTEEPPKPEEPPVVETAPPTPAIEEPPVVEEAPVTEIPDEELDGKEDEDNGHNERDRRSNLERWLDLLRRARARRRDN